MERIKGYLEYKLDLELCGVNTFERDDKIRERYEQYLKEISVRKHSKDKQQDIKTNSKKDNNKKRQHKLCQNALEYKERKETMKYEYQDNRICMFYIADRLSDILELKDGKKAHKELSIFYEEMIYNLGVNSLHNHNSDQLKEDWGFRKKGEETPIS